MPSTTIPKKLHFVNSKSLTEQQANYIRVWAKTHPDYTINVWRDREAVANQIIFREVFNSIVQREFGHPESSPVGITLETLSHKVESEFERITNDFLVKYGMGESGLKHPFLKIALKKLSIDTEYNFEKILQQQEAAYNDLNSITNIQIHDISTGRDSYNPILFKGKEENIKETYGVLRCGNAYPLAENIIALDLLKNGGFYINSGVLPELNFETLSETQKKVIPKETQLLFEKAALEVVLESEKNSGNINNDIGNSNILKLQETNYNNDLSSLKEKINKLNPEKFFKKLGDRQLRAPGSIILESIDPRDSSLPAPTKIAVLGTTEGSTLLSGISIYHNLAADELESRLINKKLDYQGFYSDLKQLHSNRLLNRNRFTSSSDTESLPDSEDEDSINTLKEPDPVKVKWAVNAYYSLELLNLTPELNRYGDVFGDSVIRKYYDGSNLGEPEKLFSQNHVYPPCDQTPVARIEPPARYARGQNYDSQIIISLDDDPWIYNEAYLEYSNVPINKSTFIKFNVDSSQLIRIHGKLFRPDEKTRIILIGHSNNSGFKTVTVDNLASIFQALMPGGGKVKRIALRGCRLADKSHKGLTSGVIPKNSNIFVATLFRALKNINIFTHDITASQVSIYANFLGNNIFLDKRGRVPIESRKMKNTRYVYSLMDDGNISYTVKEGLPALSPDIQNRPDLFDQKELSRQFGRDSIISHETSSEITSHNILIDSDIVSAIQIGTLKSLNEQSTIVIAEPNETKYNRIIEILSSTSKFNKYKEWKSWIGKNHPDLLFPVEYNIAPIPDYKSAYKRFRNRVVDGVFSFVKLDPTSHEDASIIKQRYPDGFARIYLPDIPAHELCRPRRSPSGGSCRLNFEEAKSSLKLLSDDQTRIVVSKPGQQDVLLLDPSGNQKLTDFQQTVRDLKTELTDANVNRHHNYHNYIALDAESMLQAKRLATKSDKPGKALQLNQQRKVLLDSNNAVFLRVEGGAGNSLTLLGNPDSFRSANLVRTVTDFIVGEQIGRLTIGVVKNGISVHSVTTEFSAVNLPDFQALTASNVQFQMIDPQSAFTASDPIKIASLADGAIISNRDGEIETPSMSIDTRSKPAPALKHTQFLRQTLEQEAFSQPIVRNSDSSMIIRSHIESAAAGLSSLLSQSSLSTDLIPRLDSLKRVRGKWKLQFYSVDESTSHITTKNLDISDPKLLASLQFINEKVSLGKQSLQNVRRNPIGAVDAIGDGIGVAMTLGTLVYQMFRNDALQSDQSAPQAGSDMQRRILEVQIIYGMVNEHIATVDALLTVGKYVIAIKKGESVVSLGERMAAAMNKHRRASAAALTSGKTVSTLGSRALRLSGPVLNLAISVGTLTLDIMALSACETKNCRENAGVMLGLNIAQTLPILISLGANAASAAGLVSAASAASAASAMSIVALPVSLIATILVIGEQFNQEMRQNFEGNMAFWQMVYDDLILKNAWDSTDKTWNMLTRDVRVSEFTGKYKRVYKRFEQDCSLRKACTSPYYAWVNEPVMRNVIRQRGKLAPISEIDFATKQLKYSSIRLYKIKNWTGSVYLNDGESGPAYSRRVNFYGCNPSDIIRPADDKFDLLAHPQVSRWLAEQQEWPEENIEKVILPSAKSWSLAKWHYQTVSVSDATHWGQGKSEGKGWQLLMHASRKGLSEDANSEFSFAFFPRLKGSGSGKNSGPSCSFSRGKTQPASAFILKDVGATDNIRYSSTPHHLKVTAAHYNQTFIVPDDSGMSYSFYGQGGHNYTVAFTHFSKADFHQTGNEQWTIDDQRHFYSLKDFHPFTLGNDKPVGDLITLKMKKGHVNDAECTMRFMGFNATSAHSYPVVVIDKFRYPHYILDARAGRFKVYYPEVKDAFQLSYRSRAELWRAYKNPFPDTHALNKPQRFHELTPHRWLDVEPEQLADISITGQYTHTLIKGELTPVNSGSQGIALPADTIPMAGAPDLGYLFFSPSLKKLYYRQPLDQTNGDMAEIPAQFISRVGSAPDRFQFSLQSSQRVTYHLEKLRKLDGENRSVPVIRPTHAIWVKEKYLASVNEMKQFPSDQPTAAQIIRKKQDKQALTKGFFDAQANSGQGRVIIWHRFAVVDTFFIDNTVNEKSSEQMGKDLARVLNRIISRRPNAEKKTLELIDVKRDTEGERYLFFYTYQKTSGFYVVDTGGLSSMQLVHKIQPSVFPTSIMLNHKRKRIINAALSSLGNEILFTFDDSVTFGISRSILDPLLAPMGPRRHSGKLDATGYDLWVRGVSYSQRDAGTDVSDLVRQKLTPYINRSAPPIMKVPPIVPVHGYVPQEQANNPLDISSWYVVEAGFVYVTKSTIPPFGFDAPSNTLYAFDIDTREVLSAKCNTTRKRCGKLTGYTPYRHDYKTLYLQEGVVYGLDHSDNIYRLEKHRRVLVRMDISKDLQSFDLEQATRASLKAKIDSIVQAKLNAITKEQGTELPEELPLSYTQNIPYQLWYHTAASKVAPEGLYLFAGSQKLAFLGSTLTQGQSIDWFSSASPRLLFKQANNTIQTLGPYDSINIENGGNSLAVKGYSGADRLPELRLGQHGADTTLHLNGGGGNDLYPVTEAMIRHYQSIVVDNRVRAKADGFIPASSKSVVRIGLPANEFSASSGSNALQLFHHPTRHSLFFPAHHPMGIKDRQGSSYSFPAGKLILSFTGLRISLNQLLEQTLRQPDAPWQLPVDISRINAKTELNTRQDQPFKLSVPDGYYLKDFHGSKTIDGWHLKFQEGERIKRINVQDKDRLAAKAGNFWITRGYDNTPIYMLDGITSKIKQNLHFLRKALKSIKNQQYGLAPTSDNGLEYHFISTEQLRKPVERKSPGTDTNDNEWLIFTQHSYDSLAAEYTGVTANAPGSQVYEPVLRITDQSANQTAELTSMPEAVVFAWSAVFKGWPLKTTGQFALGDSDPLLLMTTANDFIKTFTPEGHDSITQLPEPVLYNFRAQQLSVVKDEGSDYWHIRSQKDLILNIRGRSRVDSLSLTLAEKNGDKVTGTSHYLAMPYAFDQWVLRSTHSTDSGFPFYLGPENGTGVGLSPLLSRGFIPEQQMADLLMAKSLGMYNGVYFKDGLKTASALKHHLSQQPLTLVTGRQEATGDTSFSGNALNNVIPVAVHSRASGITVNGKEGDDFIQVVWNKARNWQYKTWPGLNRNIQSFLKSPRININAGSGDDILDLPDLLRVKVEDSPGEDTVCLSHFSRVDMLAMKQWTLFIRESGPKQIEPVLVAKKGYRYQVVASPDQATEVFLREVGQPERLFARVDIASKGSIHFADGGSIRDFQSWLSAYTPPAATIQPAQTVTSIVSPTESVDGNRYSGPTNATEPLSARSASRGLESVREKLKSLIVYRQSSEAMKGEALFQQQLNRLVQDMGVFAAGTEAGENTATLATATITPSPSLVSPQVTSMGT